MDVTSRSGGEAPEPRRGGATAYPAGPDSSASAAGTAGPTRGTGAAGGAGGDAASGAAGGSARTDHSGNGHGRGAHQAAPADALKDAAARLGEVKEYAGYFLAAKMDGWKASLRNLGIYAGLGLVGAIVGGAVLATAAVLLLIGIAHGLGDLLGNKMWLGELIVGLLILGGATVGIIFGLKYLTGTFKKQLVAKYEDRQRQQRTNFGHDVEERAVQREAEAWADRAAK